MEVERTHWYPASPEEVWDQLTDPETLAEWFGDRSVVIDAVEPRRRIVWTWEGEGDDPSSTVTIDVEPDGEGTSVTVLERPVVATTVPIGFRPRTVGGEQSGTGKTSEGPRALARI